MLIAGVAQSVEQRIRNAQVTCSSHATSSIDFGLNSVFEPNFLFCYIPFFIWYGVYLGFIGNQNAVISPISLTRSPPQMKSRSRIIPLPRSFPAFICTVVSCGCRPVITQCLVYRPQRIAPPVCPIQRLCKRFRTLRSWGVPAIRIQACRYPRQ